jgi:hypothetical protein
MSLPKFNPRTPILLLAIVLTGIVRFVFIYDNALSPLSNFSPLGAMAVFSGAYFNKSWKALSFPLLTLFLSDLILSFTVFSSLRNGFLYGGWYWTYGAFILMTLSSRWLIRKISVQAVFGAVLLAVFIHWIVTDFGVWMGSTIYAQTLTGYALCLVAAIPFELNLLAGTVLYSVLLFGIFEWTRTSSVRAGNIKYKA